MNKRAILKKITDKLIGELEVYFRAAEYARDEATHEQNKAENKYDTRGLEASYLARGQSNVGHRGFGRVREICQGCEVLGDVRVLAVDAAVLDGHVAPRLCVDDV